MKSKFGENWCLIYLSGTDSNPSNHSVTLAQLTTWEENNQYRKINFGQIAFIIFFDGTIKVRFIAHFQSSGDEKINKDCGYTRD